MEQDLITYEDKVALDEQPSVADKNKVKDTDMNQIKNVINGINNGSQPLNNLVVGNIESKNLSGQLVKGIVLNSNTGVQYNGSSTATSDFIPVDFNKNQNYYVSGLISTLWVQIFAYNSNKQFLGRTASAEGANRILTDDIFTSGTAQGTGNIAYLRIMQYVAGGVGNIDDIDNAKIQVEPGNTATPYTEHIAFNNNPYVLWTNPSPSSAFTSQTITLSDNISNYKYYEIIYIAYANNSLSQDTFLSTGKLVGERTKLFSVDHYSRRRIVSGVSGTNVTFGDGGTCTAYGTDTWSTMNALCVPYQVLGYK